jgi:glycosyltransferase involved in cell wall biosynthesis
MTEMRPRVLAVLPSLFPSTIIGVARPLLRLHQAGAIDLELTLQSLAKRSAVDAADVLVLCHTIDPDYAAILDWAREGGVPLIYEVDDNLLDLPPEIPGLDYLREPVRRAKLIACLQQAEVVRTYSTELQRCLAPYNANVVVVSGPLEWNLTPATRPPAQANRIRLVYATSRIQDGIGPMLIPALRRVLAAFPQAELTIWGPRLEGVSGDSRVRHLPFVREYDEYFTRFAREGFDIGLAPLPDGVFYRCKSNLKFREYAACGIAGIYADSVVYHGCVVDGVTGLLARGGDDAWSGAMARLIEDADLRTRIQRDARAYALEHYNERRTDADWMAAITPLAARRARDARRSAPHAPGRERVGGHPVAIALGLVRQACRLAAKTPRVIRRHGASDAFGRAWRYLLSFRQMLAWEVRRWRFDRRTARLR